MHGIVIVAGVICFCFVGLFAAMAEDLTQQQKVLNVIKATAYDICYTVEQQGQQSEKQLSGEVQAKLNSVIAKLIGLNVKGSGELRSRPKPNTDTGGEFKNEWDDPLYTGLSKTEK